MWTRKREWTKRFVLPCLLLSCWLLPSAGTTSQAETMYTISESELTRLEVNLNQLEKNNETKQNLLTEQQKQLQIVNEQLKKSRKLNEETQTSLAEARKSFSEYEKEAERKIRIKTRQRNLWISIAAICATAAIAK